MRTCPLCETSVLGSSCEVCGHALAAPPDPAALIPRLADLELQEASMAAVPVASLLEIEPTRFAATPAPEPLAVPELVVEATLAAAAPDVVAGGMPDLDRGREPGEERTPRPSGPARCRYCQHVQAEGRLCDRCGMRLPPSLATATANAPGVAPEGLVWCRSCGERTYPGARCANCGAVLVTGR